MFVDASAVVAILGREPDWSELVARLDAVGTIVVSPIVIWESVVAIAHIRRSPVEVAQRSVEMFLIRVGAEIMPIDSSVGEAAVAAFTRLGKGRHPAGLKMGDCFAYASAGRQGLPLLCKGEDFPPDRRPPRLSASIYREHYQARAGASVFGSRLGRVATLAQQFCGRTTGVGGTWLEALVGEWPIGARPPNMCWRKRAWHFPTPSARRWRLVRPYRSASSMSRPSGSASGRSASSGRSWSMR